MSAQLTFAFAADDLSAPAGTTVPAAPPVLSRHVKAGPARLLRRLIATGLDPQALERAAALVVALDEGAS
jgi:hypothetical protein